jgi:hypothetical protein
MDEEKKSPCADLEVYTYPGNCADFLDQLVQKCEASNYPEMYQKLLQRYGGLVRCDDLFAQDAKKSLEKITQTIAQVPGVIMLWLFDPKTVRQAQKDPNAQFKKLAYLVSEEGLIRVIMNYRREKFLRSNLLLSELYGLWEVSHNDQPKLETMLNAIIQRQGIYAKISASAAAGVSESDSEKRLVFQKISEVPQKRKLILQLVAACIILVSAIIIFIRYFVSPQI